MIEQIICPIHLITVTWTYFSSFSPLYVTLTFLVLYQSVPLLLFIVKDNDSVCFCLAISCSEFQQLLPMFTHISFALRTPKPTFNEVHSNSGFTLRSPHCGCLNTMYWRFSDSCLYYYERQRKSGDREAGCMPSGPALSWEKLLLMSTVLCFNPAGRFLCSWWLDSVIISSLSIFLVIGIIHVAVSTCHTVLNGLFILSIETNSFSLADTRKLFPKCAIFSDSTAALLT